MIFVEAKEGDVKEIRQLYKSAIGSEGCTWSEEYPGIEHTEGDLKRHGLFCLKAENGEVIGAISIDDDELVENLPFFHRDGAELARLVVKESYQNQGIAGKLLEYAMEILRERGYTYVHFLVSKYHKKALRAYEKLHFHKVGETDLYEGQWWCYEKPLKSL